MKVLQIIALIFGLTVFAAAQKSILSGIVYDANGSVIFKAKVTAINQKGERFDALTEDDGIYTLSLPFNQYAPSINFQEAKYDIVVEMNGFKKSVTKDFVFVPSQFGKMQFDIGLEIGKIIDTISVSAKKIRKKSKK
jgi:hypothetical protein